ncbi:MAG: phosphoglucomutase/phosphomannomutase family protein [Clostridia bacterium]|nr:phosphoglucomutase/phosphomannomutase family protein [Clostridia bacterium]
MIGFGTGGFRGVIGEEFTRENVRLIAEGLSRIAEEDGTTGPIVVGYDNRFISDRAAVWLAEVFAAHGIKVLKFGRTMPTPAIMFAVKDLGLSYGAMVTASHNPYYFNGVKLFLKGGVDADAAFTDRLERTMSTITEPKVMPFEQAKKEGLIEHLDNLASYLGVIRSFISPQITDNRVKILYDNLCGVGAVGLRRLTEDYNIRKFDILNAEHDAFFGFSLPNPTEEMMRPLAEKVVREGYDFAMATDSDADRLGILDERGHYIDSNDILACIYYYLTLYRGMRGDVVKNCATSLLLDKLADKFGQKCHEVDVGFKNVSQKMAETDALIGGESSGGLTVRGYVRGKDSVFSASLFMEMVIVMKKPVSEIIREVHAFADYGMCGGQEVVSLKTLKPVKAYLAEHTPKLSVPVIETQSYGRNFKYILQNGWALLRMSGTEPVLRIFAETESEQMTHEVIHELKDSVLMFA